MFLYFGVRRKKLTAKHYATRGGVRTHADIPALDLKSNALDHSATLP